MESKASFFRVSGDVGKDAFHPGDHVLDLHGMSASSAKMALQEALVDAKRKPRALGCFDWDFLFVFFSVKQSGDVFFVGGLGGMRFMAS